MTSITSIFNIVQYNNYNELDRCIKTSKIDLLNSNRKNEYIIPYAIKYRSKECFDLLVESKYFNPNEPEKNGLIMALEYYCNSKNESNSHYINILKNKFVKFSHSAITIILNTDSYNEFSDFVIFYINENLNENFKRVLCSSINNMGTFKKILDIGLSMNLVTYDFANNIINSTQYSNKTIDIIIEFTNNGINVLNDKDTVVKYIIEKFDDINTVKYLVDNVISYNLDLSLLLIKYINGNMNYRYNNFNNTCYKLYNIYKNYENLKKINCNFQGGAEIVTKTINAMIESGRGYGYYDVLPNTLLFLIKIFDLFFDEKIITTNCVIKKTTNMEILLPKNKTLQKYHEIQKIQYILKYFENKGIKSDELHEIKKFIIPEANIINVGSLLPKKLKPIKK